ncbi:MAG: hypothetical protein RMK18_02730 [Armatimonadota bacterium]|nr:hypothetical protein [Armatimonadota bacterium]MDW8024771.1 hypothetical protein [Armatimonadota bacterium]
MLSTISGERTPSTASLHFSLLRYIGCIDFAAPLNSTRLRLYQPDLYGWVIQLNCRQTDGFGYKQLTLQENIITLK